MRRTLRNRARYEVANNSYARGIVLTLANDTVGTGPRLQMLTGLDAVNRTVERRDEGGNVIATEYLTDIYDEPVVATVNEQMLQGIAQATGGAYVRLIGRHPDTEEPSVLVELYNSQIQPLAASLRVDRHREGRFLLRRPELEDIYQRGRAADRPGHGRFCRWDGPVVVRDVCRPFVL